MFDTSVLGQRGERRVRDRLAATAGDSWVCDMVVAESVTRSRSPEDLRARLRFFESVPVLPVDRPVWTLVTEWAGLIAAGGRSVTAGDVIIAACASLNSLTVLHYDSDYEVLGGVCDVSHEWVVPPGTL